MSTSTFETRWQQFRTLPRAIQWLSFALLAVVMYIVVNDYVWALSRDWNAKADTIESQVRDAGNIKMRELQARTLEPVVVALGPVELPLKQTPSGEALNAAWTEIKSKYRSVTDERFDAKGAATVSNVLTRIMPPGTKIDRISAELRFDATVGDAISIIADLESRPEVESISTVRITKLPPIKKVRVNLTIDAWVISEGKRRPGAGNA